METELKEKISLSIERIENKENKIFFFVQDTRGNAKASLVYLYDMAYTLHKDGYTVVMLHEKPDYTKIGEWSDLKYDELTHQSIEGTNLEVTPEDIMVVPEIFGFIMEQIKNLPCGKIVITQAYDHVLETLTPGTSWPQLGFYKCITTSETQKNQIEKLMKRVTVDVISPVISDKFEKQKYPAKPIIAVHTRDQRDGINLIKQFYLKYPQYRFFTFRDLRGVSMDEFANAIQDAFLGVWIDPTSGFGTFPLECMKVGIPVLGLKPNLKPEWLEDKNGIWVDNQIMMVDIIADLIQTWLEDNLLKELYVESSNTAEKYTNKEKFESEVLEIFSDFSNKRKEAFVAQLNPETV
jgi:hypothetical protein